MKHCPTCRADYRDDSLSFCLNDGTALVSDYQEQETRVIQKETVANSSFGKNFEPSYQNRNVSEPAKSNTGLIFGTIAGLILLLAGLGISAYFLIARETNQTGQTVMPTPSATPKEDNELKEKIANLEKQLQEQKKSGNQKTTSTTKTPAPLNKDGKVTAQVKQTGDGFLALRTEPSVKTGTQLVKIPSGAQVEVEDCQTNSVTIDGRRGRWCMITYDGKVGWAFDAWLNY